MRIFDWCFRSRTTGHITIAQFPNLPLWIFFVTVGLRRIVATGSATRTTVDWIGVISLGWWAVDELLRGVNPWRRLLGLVGTTFALAGVVALVR